MTCPGLSPPRLCWVLLQANAIHFRPPIQGELSPDLVCVLNAAHQFQTGQRHTFGNKVNESTDLNRACDPTGQ
jgi:hypothetical protein